MQYRKLRATKIFDGYRFLEDQVLILSKEGVVETLLPLAEAGEGVEMLEGILSPGFVNCHCHLELSHMRGKIPEGTGLVDFVWKVVTQRSAPEEEILSAIAAAEAEMKEGGIVAVGDICNNTSTFMQKQKGHLFYYNFIEASGWLPAGAPVRFAQAKKIYEAFCELENRKKENRRTDGQGTKMEEGMRVIAEQMNKEQGRQKESPAPNAKRPKPNCSLVPHAPYSVSEELWQLIQPYFAGKVVSIHNQETRHEDPFFQEGTGDFTRMYQLMNIDNSHHRPTKRSSLQSYFDKLLGAERIILVHNTFTTKEDIDFVLQQTRNHGAPPVFFCLCPNANLYIEGVLPRIDRLWQEGCLLVLGTDSLASNHSLDILGEIKTIREKFSHIPLEELLSWATSNGARALCMDNLLGSFETGKRPGGVLLDERSLTLAGRLF